jgi:hypothetical protein
MPQIQLDEGVFRAVQRRAADGGYSTVDEYIADMVVHDLVEGGAGETPNLDHLFTPACLEQIDQAAAEIDAGHSFTAPEVREHFKQKRAARNQKNGER